MRRTIGTIAVVVLLAFCLQSVSVDARRRRRKRKKKAKGVISAAIVVKARAGAPRITRAYWWFGMPGVQEKRRAWGPSRFLVFLNTWDDDRAAIRVKTEIEIIGGAIEPGLLVMPRTSSTAILSVRNRDFMTHRLRSKAHAFNMELSRDQQQQVKLSNIPPVPVGAYASYKYGSPDFPRSLRGEVVLLRSTNYRMVRRNRRFKMKRIPKGTHSLTVYGAGRVLLKKQVEVGKRTTKLGVLTIVPPTR